MQNILSHHLAWVALALVKGCRCYLDIQKIISWERLSVNSWQYRFVMSYIHPPNQKDLLLTEGYIGHFLVKEPLHHQQQQAPAGFEYYQYVTTSFEVKLCDVRKRYVCVDNLSPRFSES